MCLSVHGGYLFPPHGFQRIPQDVPLRVSATWLLYIAGVRFVSALPERLAYGLGFLARNQYLQSQHPRRNQDGPQDHRRRNGPEAHAAEKP